MKIFFKCSEDYKSQKALDYLPDLELNNVFDIYDKSNDLKDGEFLKSDEAQFFDILRKMDSNNIDENQFNAIMEATENDKYYLLNADEEDYLNKVDLVNAVPKMQQKTKKIKKNKLKPKKSENTQCKKANRYPTFTEIWNLLYFIEKDKNPKFETSPIKFRRKIMKAKIIKLIKGYPKPKQLLIIQQKNLKNLRNLFEHLPYLLKNVVPSINRASGRNIKNANIFLQSNTNSLKFQITEQYIDYLQIGLSGLITYLSIYSSKSSLHTYNTRYNRLFTTYVTQNLQNKYYHIDQYTYKYYCLPQFYHMLNSFITYPEPSVFVTKQTIQLFQSFLFTDILSSVATFRNNITDSDVFDYIFDSIDLSKKMDLMGILKKIFNTEYNLSENLNDLFNANEQLLITKAAENLLIFYGKFYNYSDLKKVRSWSSGAFFQNLDQMIFIEDNHKQHRGINETIDTNDNNTKLLIRIMSNFYLFFKNHCYAFTVLFDILLQILDIQHLLPHQADKTMISLQKLQTGIIIDQKSKTRRILYADDVNHFTIAFLKILYYLLIETQNELTKYPENTLLMNNWNFMVFNKTLYLKALQFYCNLRPLDHIERYEKLLSNFKQYFNDYGILPNGKRIIKSQKIREDFQIVTLLLQQIKTNLLSIIQPLTVNNIENNPEEILMKIIKVIHIAPQTKTQITRINTAMLSKYTTRDHKQFEKVEPYDIAPYQKQIIVKYIRENLSKKLLTEKANTQMITNVMNVVLCDIDN